MLFAKFVALALSLGVASVWAAPSVPHRGCGNVVSDAEVLKVEQEFTARKVVPSPSQRKAQGPIKVYWHVITNGAVGNISDASIAAQMSVTSGAYSVTGVTFELAEIDRTDNATLFRNAGPENAEQTAMKTALRKGGAYDLNIYSVGFESDETSGLLGYATFPWEYEANPKDDGIVMHYDTVPGGGFEPYNLGHTLTHEAGHWVGLWHTFQGGCSGTGDSVDDTPAQLSPTFGCPASRDSCPRQAGTDPIHNFMDYSDDACMTDFTPGQTDRLTTALATYRNVPSTEP